MLILINTICVCYQEIEEKKIYSLILYNCHHVSDGNVTNLRFNVGVYMKM